MVNNTPSQPHLHHPSARCPHRGRPPTCCPLPRTRLPGRRLLIPQPGEDVPVALACCSSLPFLEGKLRGGRDFCVISNARSLVPRTGTRQADLMPTRVQSCSLRHYAAVKTTKEGSVLRGDGSEDQKTVGRATHRRGSRASPQKLDAFSSARQPRPGQSVIPTGLSCCRSPFSRLVHTAPTLKEWTRSLCLPIQKVSRLCARDTTQSQSPEADGTQPDSGREPCAGARLSTLNFSSCTACFSTPGQLVLKTEEVAASPEQGGAPAPRRRQ